MPLIKILLLNLWVAIGYFSTGVIGSLLTIEPSNSSPVWPAAGVALAVMLLYGWRVLVGLFVGIFFTQVYVSFDGAVTEGLKNGVGLILIKAFASSAQAVIGSLLIHCFVGRQDTLLNLSKVLLFFFYGAIISCLIAPTISIGAFYLQNIISANDCFLAWVTWWIGDVIGTLIFTPIMLTFLAQPQSVWRPRRLTVAAPLSFLLLLLVGMYFYSKQQEDKRINILFNHRVERVQNLLIHEINAHTNIAKSIRDFFYARQEVTADEFYLLSKSHLKQHPDIVAIEWIPRILANSERALSASNIGSFPVKYIEPLQGNETALGFDITQSKTALITLKKIFVTGKTLSTGVIRLVQDSTHSRVTSIIYSPVYKKNIPEYKPDSLLGVIAVIFSLNANIMGALSPLADNQLLVEIKNNQEVFYSNFIDSHIKPISFVTLQSTKTFENGGVSWQISFRPSEQFLSIQTTWHIWWALFGGLLLTSFTSVGLLLLTGRTAQISEQVKIKTRDLRNTNSRLNQQIELRQQLEAEQLSRNAILEAVAKGKDFKKILTDIITSVEKSNPEMICSILLLDEKGQHLHLGAAISLPDFYTDALEGMAIGEGQGSCGTAAYTAKRVIVENIMTHPFWASYKALAESAGLQACWSEPVVSSKKKVLATFAIYFRSPRAPSREDKSFIQRMAELTAITIERKQAEDELRIAAITFQSHDAVVITDINGTILRINQAYTDITGYSAAEVLGKNANILNSGTHNKAFFTSLYSELANKGRWEGEVWNRRKNGEVFPERMIITAVIDDLKITHYIGIFSDISDQKQKEEKIKQLAFYDPLTALPNRRLLLERLDQAVINTKRHKYFGAVIYLDLDHFKSLNDTLGHHVGDEMLVMVAARIKSVIRQEDTACRLGGDEFVVLISVYDTSLVAMIEQASIVAEKIRDILNQPFDLAQGQHLFSCSIGVSVFPDTVEEPVQILEQADTAMYRSKKLGRNRVSFFSEQMQAEHNRKAYLERMLLTALNQKQFLMYYQGQTNDKGQILSAEALLRWQHPEQGMVSPAEFIPIAENSHLIVDIGNWVLTTVCQQIKKWQDSGYYLEHIAVNISPRQFRQEDFIAQLKKSIAHAGIEAKYLMLELTEGIVIEDIQDTINKMLQIQLMGITISIDDFGTGYSSLTYLKQLPLSQLKIDQSFVRDINIDTSDEIIVESIIALAHKLGLEVIAEGVETAEQLAFLTENGCKKYQGYYFYRPVVADVFLKQVMEDQARGNRSVPSLEKRG